MGVGVGRRTGTYKWLCDLVELSEKAFPSSRKKTELETFECVPKALNLSDFSKTLID